MQQVMRKYRKYILIFIILFVGIPMLFFGVPTAFDAARGQEGRVIATVGGVDIFEGEFRQNFMAQNTAEMPAAMRQERALEVLDSMIDSALIENLEKDRRIRVNEELLIGQMREWEQFQDENGNFDPQRWNQWVRAFDQRGMNWKDVYDDMTKSLARQVYMNTVLARADRMFEDELARKVEDEFTSYRIRYAQLDIEPEVTDEDLRAHFEENQDRYRLPNDYVAEFVAIPLTPPMPEEAAAIVEQARGGADFAALADEHAGQGVQSGGDIGWQRRGAVTLEHREPLFALEVGEVSDPVPSANGYFIYYVEDERTDEESGAREVKARQIFLPAELTEADRAEREARAEAIMEAAAESDFATAAEAEGLTVQETGRFNASSNDVPGVPRTDLSQFTNAFEQPGDGPLRTVTGRSYIYVAHVTETIDGALPDFEEVADRVRTDAVAAARRSEAHRASLEALGDRLAEEATRLEDLPGLDPRVDLDIVESDAFSGQDFFVQGVFIQSEQLIDQLRDKALGELVGPIRNALQDLYFVELLERTEPTEEDRAQFAEARERIRENETLRARFELLDDFRNDLRAQMLDSGHVSLRMNNRVLEDILAALAPEEDEDAPGLLVE